MWFRFSQENEEQKFAQYLSGKYGAEVRLYLTRNNDLKVDHLVVPKNMRNRGVGTAIMNEIVQNADENGYRIILQTAIKDPYIGTTSTGRLKKFYKQFGFKENKGKDFSISENMLRSPK